MNVFLEHGLDMYVCVWREYKENRETYWFSYNVRNGCIHIAKKIFYHNKVISSEQLRFLSLEVKCADQVNIKLDTRLA